MPDASAERNLESAAFFGIGRLFWLTHEAIVGADLDTELVVLWNPSAERIFGYTADEAIGMPLDRLVPSALVGAHHAGIQRYRGMAPPRLVGGAPVEVPAVRRNGEPLVVALTLTALDEGAGRRHVFAVIRDVTAQRAAEEERQRTFDAMQAFVATASHDLRTPLTSVLGYARMLVDRGESLPAELRAEFAATILRAGEQASRLVDDLLTLSKIQAGVVDVRAGTIALAVAAREALSAVDVAADVDIPEDMAVVADEDHLQRILTNLLVNASKYGRPPIRMSGGAAGGQVELRVSDGGDGVPSDIEGALFEPFTRAEQSHGQPGTGLGLSIVRGLAEANGGAVRYDGDADGACFVLSLPKAG